MGKVVGLAVVQVVVCAVGSGLMARLAVGISVPGGAVGTEVVGDTVVGEAVGEAMVRDCVGDDVGEGVVGGAVAKTVGVEVRQCQ